VTPKFLVATPPHLEDFASMVRRYANATAAFYQGHVYLTGSALVPANEQPRDWDIRVEMPDDAFERMFGPVEQWFNENCTGNYTRVRWQWAASMAKESKQAWDQLGRFVDFQVYPLSYCRKRYWHTPALQLDTMPDREPELVAEIVETA
jgi:hypothetical protein